MRQRFELRGSAHVTMLLIFTAILAAAFLVLLVSDQVHAAGT